MKRVTATEAARQFSDLINQVRYQGESFLITRNGEDIGVLSPAPRRCTLGELFQLLQQFPVDDSFADDLEKIQSEQQMIPLEDPWAT